MPAPATLKVDHVSKRYNGVTALDDISLEVRAGELVGFVGGNGAGKSTTMRIILGVTAPDSGRVTIGAHPVDFDTRRRIGYMPEERGLYPKMPVAAQLIYLGRLHGLSADTARAAAHEWLHRLDLATRADDTVDALSLGNRQRVQLAAALLHDPDVLVLDEPFSGLDPIAVEVMSEVLKEKAAAGVSVLFSSHQLELVEKLCDRIAIIAAGRIHAFGTLDELSSHSGRHVEVTAPLAPSGWADGIPGVRVVTHDHGHTLLELTGDADDQAILAAALTTGPVHSFTTRRPPLADLFREVVAA
ncbi:ABC transporter ATP-binding protein [Nocardia sp. NPDC051570]|uniref:ABC transporter ATP-binding protein n=1 Tax=Nocardia sp. NPDC051570 TaxID=3364324 RepID=UPI0037A360B8